MAETTITDALLSTQVRYFVSPAFLTRTEREPWKQSELTLEGHADATAIPKLPNSTVPVATKEGLSLATTTCKVGPWEILGNHVSEIDTGHIE